MPSAVRHFYEFGQFRLDAGRHRLLRDGEPVPLSPKAMEALLVLVRSPGKLMEREALMQAVWADTFVEDANLTVAISHLRKALGQNGETAEYIETVPRVGYRFAAPVREIREEPAPLIIEKRTLSRTVIEEELVPDEPQAEVNSEGIVARPTAARRLPVSISRNATVTLLAVAALSAIALAAIVYFKNGERKPSIAGSAMSIRSIAVLPPRFLTAQAEDASLSLGMADALITRLGAIRKVVVRPTSAIVHYVDSNSDPIVAGRALGVDAVLEGNLQRANGRMRVTLRLLDVANGTQLWDGNFEESDADIFKLQDSVAQRVAAALFVDLSQHEKTLLARQQTANPEAYALYLKGNYYWSKRGDEAIKSLDYFRRAIELDPNFAQAYVGLASVDATASIPSPEAEAMIEKALQLDSSLAEAHATYGFIRMFHYWDWATAERELDRAIELNPNSANAHHWKGVYLSLQGRLDEAKAEMQRALDLDPLSLIILADIGQLHYFAHEYDQAIEYCNRALALDPKFEMAHTYLMDIYRMKGMEQEFFNEWIKVDYRDASPENLRRLRELFVRTGPRGIWQRELKGELNDSQRKFSAQRIARLCLMLGDRERALFWLNLSLEDLNFWLPYMSVDPLYDPLRADPRFKQIVHRLGL